MAVQPKVALIDNGAAALPAVFVNHVQVTQYSGSAGLVRISFGEMPVPNQVTYRTVIIMPQADVKQFATALLNMVQQSQSAPASGPAPRPN